MGSPDPKNNMMVSSLGFIFASYMPHDVLESQNLESPKGYRPKRKKQKEKKKPTKPTNPNKRLLSSRGPKLVGSNCFMAAKCHWKKRSLPARYTLAKAEMLELVHKNFKEFVTKMFH